MTARAAIAVLLTGAAVCAGLAGAHADSPHQPAEVIGPPVVQDMTVLIDRLAPATVFVLSADELGQVVQGTGVVMRSDGWIATSFDVVSWTEIIEVQLLVDGRVQAFDAALVRTYPSLNLALLHVLATDLTTLPSVPPERLSPGERVVGVGYPTYNRLERGLRVTRGQLASPISADTPPLYPQLLAELLYVSGLAGSAVCTTEGELVGVLIGQNPDDPSLVRILPADEVLARIDAVAERYIVPSRSSRTGAR